MNKLLADFYRSIFDSVRNLAPIVLVIAFFQIFILRQNIPDIENIIAGAIMVVLGLSLFVKGLEMGLFPIGESMAHAFARKGSVIWLLAFSFALGYGTTIAEPALIVIAEKAAEAAVDGGVINNDPAALSSYAWRLRMTVGLSVGLSLVLGVLRIIKGWPVQYLIICGYAVIMVLTLFAPAEIIGIAYDSGGVTTSTITVPLVTALGIGLSSSIKGRNPMLDGFGLIALASLLPIAFMLVFGMLI